MFYIKLRPLNDDPSHLLNFGASGESLFLRKLVLGIPAGTSNIIPFRRPFFFLIQLVVVLI
jgi:hypothetical protein